MKRNAIVHGTFVLRIGPCVFQKSWYSNLNKDGEGVSNI
jgi:hypothetical protein